MKKLNNSNTLAWLNVVTKKSKWMIVVLTLIQIFQGIATIVKTVFLGELVDYVIAGEKKQCIYLLAWFIGIVICQISFGAINRYLNEYALAEYENRFKSRLFEDILKGRYAEVSQIHSGEWMNRLTSDTVVVSKALVNEFPGFVGSLIRLISAVVVIVWMEPRLFVILILGVIVLYSFIRIFRKVMKDFHRLVQEADGKVRVFLQERIGSLLIIRTFVREKESVTLLSDIEKEYKATRLKRNRYLNIFYTGYSFGVNGAYILGIVFCSMRILNGVLSYGKLVVVIQLLEQIQGPFAGVTGFFPRYYAMLASAERLMEASRYEEMLEDRGFEIVQEFYDKDFSAIGLSHATFSYEQSTSGAIAEKQPLVLDNINIEIGKREHVAFTGPSGCGKSTVLKLLMSLYDLDSGEVYLKTCSGKEKLNSNWRKLFAYVPQGNQLFSGTIRETIAFGDEKEMKNEIKMQNALMVACADDFVNNLENGLDTVLGERGAGLSEGQMQRIAIARAVFSERPILLLDESTSALDKATAEKVLNNLKTMTDKTVIMVTHRTGSIQTFDKEVSFYRKGVKVRGIKCIEK